MKKKKITIVHGHDWQGLYIDGKLVDEGHSLQLQEVLNLLGFKVDCKEVNAAWLNECGSLPLKLENITEA